MQKALLALLRNRVILVSTLTIFFLGFTAASSLPYLSIIGTQQLGLSANGYSLVTLAAAVCGLAGSLTFGHFSDTVRDRKPMLLVALIVGMAGYGLFAFRPSLTTFLLLQLVVAPLSGTSYGQLLAAIRASTAGKPEAAAINSIVRAVFALSWVVAPGIVGAFMATRNDVSDSMVISTGAFAFCLIVSWSLLQRMPQTAGVATGWAGFKAAAYAVQEPRVLLRVAALAAIGCVVPANMALMPLLVFNTPGASLKDVGLMAGLVALMEIPFMLVGAWLVQRWRLHVIIIAGGLVHASYLAGLGFATSLSHLYGLAVLNAAGAAATLSIHITYLQGLLPDRPGLGTSLYSVNVLANRTVAAGLFALAGLSWGLQGAALSGATLVLAGCGAMLLLDRRVTSG
jgi:predicted MFS family arabinose efflux permease